MKFTNEQLGKYVDVLSGCNETGKLGYAIARNLRRMTDAAKEYLDLRSELLSKYGKQTGNIIEIREATNPEGFKAYQKQMQGIPEIESDVDIFTVDEDTFCSGNLTSVQMSNMLWMISDTPEKKD